MSDSNQKFDLSFLNKISGGDEAFIKEMISTFKEMTPEFVAKSKLYLEEKDYEKLSKEAHKYVPGVSFLGIKDLQDDIAYVEEYAKKQYNLDKLPGLLENAYEKIAEIIEIFDKEFNL